MEKNEITTINSLSEVEITTDLMATDDFSSKYNLLSATIKQLQELKDKLDADIKTEMLKHYMETGEQSVDSPACKFTYVPAGTSKRFDAKALAENDPETYAKYVKVLSSSPSLRVTVKKDKGDENV